MSRLEVILIGIGVVVGLFLAVTINDVSQTYQPAPVQVYNAECLVYGNEVPCALIR